jgi:hypothetical protein
MTRKDTIGMIVVFLIFSLVSMYNRGYFRSENNQYVSPPYVSIPYKSQTQEPIQPSLPTSLPPLPSVKSEMTRDMMFGDVISCGKIKRIVEDRLFTDRLLYGNEKRDILRDIILEDNISNRVVEEIRSHRSLHDERLSGFMLEDKVRRSVSDELMTDRLLHNR